MNPTALAIVVAGLLLGSVPVGYLVAKLQGIDIRAQGSGNIGATNVLRVLGKGPAALVFVLDVLKGYIPAFAAHWFTGSTEWAFAAGVAAVLGHSFSPFLGFKGGKGIATGLGFLLGTSPAVGFASFGVFFIFMVFTLIVSVSSVAAAIAMPIFGFVYGDPWSIVIAYAVLGTVIVIRHRSNLARFREGKEPIVGQKVGEPIPEQTKPRLFCLALLALTTFLAIMLPSWQSLPMRVGDFSIRVRE